MDNEIDEKWINLPKVRNRIDDIVAISNTGKYKRRDGAVGILERQQKVGYDGKRNRCPHIIAEHFLITVRRPDQNCIDHISHTPSQYHVNNVLNLRWCTKAENMGFEEARENLSKSHMGLFAGDKHPMYGRTGERSPMYGKGYLLSGDKNPNWKGDNVGARGAYNRALKLYKLGEMSEEEFQHYRDIHREYHRARKKQTGVQREGYLMEKE